ncbi:4592_t:CDS:2, partial [Ambispora gerdemannii]
QFPSLAVSGIAPFLDFAGLMVFIEKISIYLLIGATFYFSRTAKEDIDAKRNSEPNTRDTIRAPKNLTTSTARLDEIEQVLQQFLVESQPNPNQCFYRNSPNFESFPAGQLTFTGISLTVWSRFKQSFDQIKIENNYTLEMCLSVVMGIRLLGENIKTTVQGSNWFMDRQLHVIVSSGKGTAILALRGV